MVSLDTSRAPSRRGAAFDAFLDAYPTYARTRSLDAIRAREYDRLDAQGHVYLDYTGGSLYAERQIQEHLSMLRSRVLGNPHSDNPSSAASTALVEAARAAVLSYVDAAPSEYTVVFTANASAALKLVGEAYPFAPGGQYLLTADHHNSVNGIREFAKTRGAAVVTAPLTVPELRIDEARLTRLLEAPATAAPRLFAYPAQSNFSGVQHPLAWIDRAHARGWDVLLDAAAFAPTNRLDLRRWRADFVSLSFYKMFGYPTGIGCLIARRGALAKLRRPWFAGGTVIAATVAGDAHVPAPEEAGFEDGTVNYLGLPAVEIGLRHLTSIGIETVHERVRCLTAWLLGALLSLRHANGAPLVRLYGPSGADGRGGTLAFNLLDPHGRAIDVRRVERAARRQTISLRTGCFCNPGAAEAAWSIGAETLRRAFSGTEPPSFEDLLERLGVEGGGAVRVSLGLASNFADAYRFLGFARSFLDRPEDTDDLPARGHC